MRVTVGKRVLVKPANINPRDWLLIIGLTLGPMTGLRIWKVGPAELLCLIWGIKYISSVRLVKNDLSQFFVSLLVSFSVGSIFGYFIAPTELRVADLLTWLYLGIIAISIYEGLRAKTSEDINNLLCLFARTAILWYLFLFIYSRLISRSFLGAPLWYSSARFSGGGTNPHQIAILLCGLTFVFLREALSKNKVVVNLLYMMICLYLMLQTASSTGILSIALGFTVVAFFWLVELFPSHKTTVIVFLSLIVILVIIIGSSRFLDSFMDWIAKDPNGMGRLNIYSSFPRSYGKSPIFGLGPGVHAFDGYIEFHNTYLEILVAGGAVGGITLLVFSIILFRKLFVSDWRLLPIAVSMYAYGLAGFAMRRLVYWGLIAFVMVIAEQIIKERVIVGDEKNELR